jgi:hypothetical protein
MAELSSFMDLCTGRGLNMNTQEALEFSAAFVVEQPASYDKFGKK